MNLSLLRVLPGTLDSAEFFAFCKHSSLFFRTMNGFEYFTTVIPSNLNLDIQHL
jgi:hypothetical protein